MGPGRLHTGTTSQRAVGRQADFLHAVRQLTRGLSIAAGSVTRTSTNSGGSWASGRIERIRRGPEGGETHG
jgi:hypothetical protein